MPKLVKIDEYIEEFENKDTTPHRKKQLDIILINYLGGGLSRIPKLSKVMKLMPDAALKKKIEPDHIVSLLQLLADLSSFLSAPIEIDAQGRGHAVYRFHIKPDAGPTTIMKYSFPAGSSEIELARQLEVNKLGSFLKVLEARTYTFDEWNSEGKKALQEIIAKRGPVFDLELELEPQSSEA